MTIKLKDIINQKLSEDELNSLHTFFRKGGTWQDVFQFSDFEIEEIYKQGYDFYQKGAFEDAKKAFLGLIHINPYSARNWFSFACVLQAEKQYKEALAAFDICLTIEDENTAAFFYSGQCSYALAEKANAKEFFQKVIDLDPFSELGQKAMLIVETLI